MSDESSSSSSDSERIASERLQKLNVVMSHHLESQQQQQQEDESNKSHLDSASLLSSKDIEGLRKSITSRPPDSYIIAGAKYLLRSIRSSIFDTYKSTSRQFDITRSSMGQQQQNILGEDQSELQKLEEERRKLLEQQQQESSSKSSDSIGVSKEGRALTLNLTAEQIQQLHPKTAEVRSELLDMEKKTHDVLDRVMRARLKFLTLAQDGEPPCSTEVRRVADCYAQIAAMKYEAAVRLEKEESTPDVIKRQKSEQEKKRQNPVTTATSSSSSSENNNSNSNKRRRYDDLPEDLLAMHEVVKLSTSVLACREPARQLAQCTEQAGLKHIDKNHQDA